LVRSYYTRPAAAGPSYSYRPRWAASGAALARRPLAAASAAASSSQARRYASSAAAEAALKPQPSSSSTTPGPFPTTPGKIDVAEWLDAHAQPYTGDASFLAGPTPRTLALWSKAEDLLHAERAAGGVLSVDPKTPATITSHPPGYIDRDLEIIVGLQTDEPLKRAIKPKGGVATVKQALAARGHDLDPLVERIFTDFRKTQNAAIFDAYTKDVRAARSSGLLTGLPDAYGRGRIIGDYRRVALYGADALIAQKEKDLLSPEMSASPMTEEKVRLREEVREQVRALQAIKEMAASYGCDVSRPATSAKEAVQWTYLAYLAAIKEQDGAAMSLGRIDAFLDAYIERDLQSGVLASEAEAQELIDDLVIKLR
jgi:formate C-acetyltransferase